MAILIRPYQEQHEPAVRDFNQRLLAAGRDRNLVFYSHSEPRWLPKTDNSDLYNEYFVALEGDIVRGGYALKWQKFSFPDGSIRSIGYYHHPLSEGIVERAYASVGGMLLRDALIRSPLLYCLGMDGYEHPLPQMLIRLGWSHCLVPFYFRIVRPFRFLRHMQAIRNSWLRRLLMDLAAFTGAGWVGWKAARIVTDRGAPGLNWETVDEFAEWIDPLWEESKSGCSLTAARDSRTLQRLYPSSQKHLTRLRVPRNQQTVGWAVVGERRADIKYGDMRVGSIVDCWALHGNEPEVARAALEVLEAQGMDLIVSNQSHQAWCEALAHAGCFKAQSNFVFAASKKLAEMLQPFEQSRLRMHFTRADGDGLPRNY
jgi:hypothetical protein